MTIGGTNLLKTFLIGIFLGLLAAAGDLLDVLRVRGRWIAVVGAIRDAAVEPGRPNAPHAR